MPGRMGGKRITVQNIQVLKVDKENNLLVLKGAVPGHKNGLLIIKEAKKRKGILRPKEAKQDDKKPEKATAKKANKK